VIVISDGTLKAAGLGYDEAIGLLKPADGELVVHVREELDDIPLPGIRSMKPEDDFGGGTVRQTDRASAEWPWPVPTIPPINAKASVFKAALPVQVEVDARVHEPVPARGTGGGAALPATEAEIDADRLERRLAAITPSPSRLSVLGLRLDPDARGVCFADIERTALALGAQAQLLPGHEVMLSSPFGSRHCRSFAECCKLLNGRTYGAIDG
jgi:hypothetical protein